MIVLLSSLRCRAAQVLLLLAKELLQEQDRQAASLSVPCRVGTCLFRPVTSGNCLSDTIGPGEAGCFRQVAALHSDHYRQVLLYMILLDQERLAAVDRCLPYTAATVRAQIMPTLHYSEHTTIALYYSVSSDVY